MIFSTTTLVLLLFHLTFCACGHPHPEPCVHGTNAADGSCICEQGWTGHHCEHITNCQNGGKAEPHRDPTYCKCTDGWTGEHCETLCQSQTCGAHGHCYHDNSHFYCVCNDGYTGIHCEHTLTVTTAPVTVCASQPCQHGGHCFEDGDQYYCQCQYPYTGTTCKDVDICSRSHCKNGGHCLHEMNTYYCHCPDNFSGRDCEIDLSMITTTTVADGCASNPCHHHGHCYSDGIQYVCVCADGYTGKNCDHAHTIRTCNGSSDILQAFVLGGRAEHPQARKCVSGGNSYSDAILMKYCSAPVYSTWKKGLRIVDQSCASISAYTIVARFAQDILTMDTGVLINCESQSISFMTQNCTGGLYVQKVTWPEIDTFFTVEW